MYEPQSQSRGMSAYNGPVSAVVRILAASIDVGLILAFYSIFVAVFRLSPLPGAVGLGLWTALSGGFWVGQKVIFKQTLGEWVWGVTQSKKQTGNVQKHRLQSAFGLRAFALTILFLGAATLCWTRLILNHPVMRQAAMMAESGEINEETRTLPFYYLLLNWPLEFAGKPVFTTIPYEKGPPKKFPGRLIAHWQSPEIQFSLQGPLTPDNPVSRDLLRECLFERFSLSCLMIKNQILMPELADLRSLQTDPAAMNSAWQISWIETHGVSGYWIELENPKHTVTRVLLVNQKGTQQRLTLTYLTGTLQGKRARSLLIGILKSAVFIEDLQKSRAGVQGELSKIHLDQLERSVGDIAFQKEIASVQAVLVSKISIDPADFEAYFHLAGTSALLRRRAGIEVLEITQPLIEAMSKFAHDLAPQDPRTKQIQALLND